MRRSFFGEEERFRSGGVLFFVPEFHAEALGDFVGIGEVEGFEAVSTGLVAVGDRPVVAISGDNFVHVIFGHFDIHLGVEFAGALFISAEVVGVGDVLGGHFKDEGV